MDWADGAATIDNPVDSDKAAIRAGLLSPTKKALLEEAEAKVARLSAHVPPLAHRPFSAEIVTGYLSDLKGLLVKDVARARTMLECLIGRITLKPGIGLYTANPCPALRTP